MPIKVTCPKCGGVLHAPDDAAGKRGRCPTCGTVLNIPMNSPIAETPAAAPGFQLRSGSPSPAAEHPFGSPPSPVAESPPPRRGADHAKKESSHPGTLAYQFAEPERGKSGVMAAPGARNLPPEPKRMPPLPTRTAPHPPGAGGAVPEDAGAWRTVERGLGWVRTGTYFVILAGLLLVGVAAYEQFASPLPDKNPGYLGWQNLGSATEIRVASVAVPMLLGWFALTIGRLGTARAPATSYSGGLLKLAALGTLIATAGILGGVVPTLLDASKNGLPLEPIATAAPWQRLALIAGLLAAVVSEGWFVVALGRIGVALDSRRTAARSSRWLVLGGIFLTLGVVGWVGYGEYPTEVNNWWVVNVQPSWDGLGKNQPLVLRGIIATVVLIGGAICLRLTGSTKRAIRSWIDGTPAV